MGTGYVRNDTANNIADGNIINASDLDGEFDAVQSAFDASTGHTHDGTTGEGAPIETIGPTQDVVATASVLRPKTDNTVDLGTTTLEYKDLFLDGTAHIDTLDVDENASITGTLGVTGTTTLGTANITTGTITTADINGGNIDGTIIGATTAAAITGTTITGTSFVTTGDMTFGDNDKAVFGAGSDLEIYHDGGNSRIYDQGTGALVMRSNQLNIQSPTGEKLAVFNQNNDVELYYDDSQKLATTSTGVDITGTVVADTADISGSVTVGNDLTITDNLQFVDSGSTTRTIMDLSGSDDIRISTGTSSGARSIYMITEGQNALRVHAGGSISFYEDTGTTAKLTWDASAESLGIGTDSPSSVIDARQTSTGGSTQIKVYNTDNSNTTTQTAALFLSPDSRGNGALIFAEKENADFSTSAGRDVSLVFSPVLNNSQTEAMRIDSSGNVGIGTSSPSEALDVAGTITSDGLISKIATTGRSTLATFQNTASLFAGNQATIELKNGGQTAFISAESVQANTGIDLLFSSNDNTGTETNKMRIAETGDISFYEDTGTTAKFFWDASAESLGIGTSSPDRNLVVNSGASSGYIQLVNTASGTAASNGFELKLDSAGAIVDLINRENGDMRFFTNNLEAMRIDSSGNTHIGGTTSVTTAVTGDNVAPKLIVEGTTATSIAVLRQDTSIVSGNSLGSLGFYGTDTTSNTPTPLAAVQALASGTHAAGDNPTDLRFFTTPDGSSTMAEAMRLDASGNLLVGKTSTGATTAGMAWISNEYLQLANTETGAGDRALLINRQSADGTLIEFRQANATVGSIGSRLGANIVITAPTATYFDGGIRPLTDNTEDIGVSSLRFKDLYLSGGISGGVGTVDNTSFKPDSTYSSILCFNHSYSGSTKTNVLFQRNGTSVGSITDGPSSVSYNTSSDYRLKTDVQPMTGATDRLKQLNPVNFEWIADGTRVDGFLAHEAQAVVPEAVTGSKDAMRDEEYEITPAVLDNDGNVVTEAVMGTRSVPDYQGIDQSKLVPLLVATIKELEARITALENA